MEEAAFHALVRHAPAIEAVRSSALEPGKQELPLSAWRRLAAVAKYEDDADAIYNDISEDAAAGLTSTEFGAALLRLALVRSGESASPEQSLAQLLELLASPPSAGRSDDPRRARHLVEPITPATVLRARWRRTSLELDACLDAVERVASFSPAEEMSHAAVRSAPLTASRTRPPPVPATALTLTAPAPLRAVRPLSDAEQPTAATTRDASQKAVVAAPSIRARPPPAVRDAAASIDAEALHGGAQVDRPLLQQRPFPRLGAHRLTPLGAAPRTAALRTGAALQNAVNLRSGRALLPSPAVETAEEAEGSPTYSASLARDGAGSSRIDASSDPDDSRPPAVPDSDGPTAEGPPLPRVQLRQSQDRFNFEAAAATTPLPLPECRVALLHRLFSHYARPLATSRGAPSRADSPRAPSDGHRRLTALRFAALFVDAGVTARPPTLLPSSRRRAPSGSAAAATDVADAAAPSSAPPLVRRSGVDVAFAEALAAARRRWSEREHALPVVRPFAEPFAVDPEPACGPPLALDFEAFVSAVAAVARQAARVLCAGPEARSDSGRCALSGAAVGGADGGAVCSRCRAESGVAAATASAAAVDAAVAGGGHALRLLLCCYVLPLAVRLGLVGPSGDAGAATPVLVGLPETTATADASTQAIPSLLATALNSEPNIENGGDAAADASVPVATEHVAVASVAGDTMASTNDPLTAAATSNASPPHIQPQSAPAVNIAPRATATAQHSSAHRRRSHTPASALGYASRARVAHRSASSTATTAATAAAEPVSAAPSARGRHSAVHAGSADAHAVAAAADASVAHDATRAMSPTRSGSYARTMSATASTPAAATAAVLSPTTLTPATAAADALAAVSSLDAATAAPPLTASPSPPPPFPNSPQPLPRAAAATAATAAGAAAVRARRPPVAGIRRRAKAAAAAAAAAVVAVRPSLRQQRSSHVRRLMLPPRLTPAARLLLSAAPPTPVSTADPSARVQRHLATATSQAPLPRYGRGADGVLVDYDDTGLLDVSGIGSGYDELGASSNALPPPLHAGDVPPVLQAPLPPLLPTSDAMPAVGAASEHPEGYHPTPATVLTSAVRGPADEYCPPDTASSEVAVQGEPSSSDDGPPPVAAAAASVLIGAGVDGAASTSVVAVHEVVQAGTSISVPNGATDSSSGSSSESISGGSGSAVNPLAAWRGSTTRLPSPLPPPRPPVRPTTASASPTTAGEARPPAMSEDTAAALARALAAAARARAAAARMTQAAADIMGGTSAGPPPAASDSSLGVQHYAALPAPVVRHRVYSFEATSGSVR